MPQTILIVDDEPAARYALRHAFSSSFRIVEAASVAEARARLRSDRPQVVLLDYNLPGESGLALLTDPGEGTGERPAVIMITAHGSERVAVEAMKAGAYDYLAKPYELDELRLVVGRALERQELRREVQGLRQQLAAEGQFGAMHGVSAPMRELFQTAERIAQTDLPVLLLGESGTGKDLLAREIHARSSRAAERFVAVNSAALPETLIESELFGYEKGAFTGATGARSGKFEQANGGTLFLDEIGDMPAAAQAKILRAAESGAVERLGGSQPVRVDIRLISATNQDLEHAIKEKRFRQDLYFRLAGAVLSLPSLRARRDDIPLLLEHFWKALQAKYERTGPELTREAILRLQEGAWPGNVRQLRTAAEKLFLLARGERVSEQDVAAAVGSQSAAPSQPDDALQAADFREARRLFEMAYLSRKLHENGGNVTRTAAAIGLERQTLQEKIRQLGLERKPGKH